MRALLAQNPRSRSGEQDLDWAIDRLRDDGWVCEYQDSEGRDPAIAEIREQLTETDAVIAVGGDGTVNSVLQAIAETEVVLGIIPRGTANDFARTLGIPDDPVAACEVIATGRTRAVDLGVVNGHYFVNACGFGLSSQVTEALDPTIKGRFGALSYAMAVGRAWRAARPFSVTVESESGTRTLDALQVTVASGPHYGGGMTVDCEATASDGLLDLQIIEPVTLAHLLAIAPSLRSGRAWEWDSVYNQAEASFQVSSSRRFEVNVDGELLTETPLQLEVRPGALQVYFPGSEED